MGEIESMREITPLSHRITVTESKEDVKELSWEETFDWTPIELKWYHKIIFPWGIWKKLTEIEEMVNDVLLERRWFSRTKKMPINDIIIVFQPKEKWAEKVTGTEEIAQYITENKRYPTEPIRKIKCNPGEKVGFKIPLHEFIRLENYEYQITPTRLCHSKKIKVDGRRLLDYLKTTMYSANYIRFNSEHILGKIEEEMSYGFTNNRW